MTDAAAAQRILAGYTPTEYHDYRRLTELLRAFAAAYPALCTLESIGQSHEGRDIWALTLTNGATGPAPEKPGYLLEANHHATEVTGSAVVIYTIHQLLTGHGTDPAAPALLDTRALYCIPRITVDGSEVWFHTPYTVRSAMRPYPEPDQLPGLHPEDLDGDGRIRTMRLQDPDGPFKVSSGDPRLLVRRTPDDGEGPFYRLYVEGRIDGWDGREVRAPRATRWGYDFNRNYPTGWKPEVNQPGAGRYPFEAPEIKARADFLLAHPNIAGSMTLHTFGGALLRPLTTANDEKLVDKELYRSFDELGLKLTGYPCRSIHETFTVSDKYKAAGSSLDFDYEQLGIFAHGAELWDIDGRSGVEGYAKLGWKKALEKSSATQEEDEIKRLAWQDRETGGSLFKPWAPFDHPQLGEVEVGGWDSRYVNNCPEQLLPEECAKTAAFILALAAATPRLAIGRTEVTNLGGSVWRIAVQVKNSGHLPTNVTQMAIDQKQAKPVTARITLPPGATIVAGRANDQPAGGGLHSGGQTLQLGHIPGRYGAPVVNAWGGAPAPTAAWADWVVTAPAGAEVTVEVACPRAGTVRTTLTLN